MDTEKRYYKYFQLIKTKMEGVQKTKILDLVVPVWTPYLVVAVAALSAAGIFLSQSPYEFPISDTYIHLTYAKNLVKYHKLTFNSGLREGIGTSSILWVVILAIFELVGISPVMGSKIFGIALLACSGCLIFYLTQKYLPDKFENQKTLLGSCITLLAVLSGSMIWTALSGMETILFLTFGLFSLWFYAKQKWLSLGVVLGLMALTRIEGIILAGVVVLVEFFSTRKITSKFLKIILPIVVLLTPWLAYLQITEGAPVTMSFVGRKIVFSEAGKILSDENSFLSSFMKLNPLVHFFCWFYYSTFMITGLISLPGPDITITNSMLGMQISLPVVSIALIVIVILPLLVNAFAYFWKAKHKLTLNNPAHRLLTVAIVWLILHNLAYAIFLPRAGAGGRYSLMNHMIFWICLFIGANIQKNKNARIAAVYLVFIFFGISLQYWQSVYNANINYVLNVKQPAVEFIENHYPPDASIGATDFGHIGFYSERPVIDLFGHVNTEIVDFRKSGGSFGDYIFQNKLCHLMLFASVDGLGIDFSHEMKLYDDPRFDLVQDAEFSIPIEEWELGNSPLYNYMPAVKIYRVIWHDQTSCW